MELVCDNCGKIEHVLVDGYPFGDRLLEGVMFIVKDVGGKPKVMGVTEDSQSYFNDLNQKKWLKDCDGYCQELDIATCPKCGDDVPVWNAVWDEPNPTMVEKGKWSPVLDKAIEELTPDDIRVVLNNVCDGCPTIDVVELDSKVKAKQNKYRLNLNNLDEDEESDESFESKEGLEKALATFFEENTDNTAISIFVNGKEVHYKLKVELGDEIDYD